MFQLFFDLCQETNTKLKFFEAILFKFKSYLNKTLSNDNNISVAKDKAANCYKSEKSNPTFKIYWKLSTSNKLHFLTCASEHKLKLTLFHDSFNDICRTI